MEKEYSFRFFQFFAFSVFVLFMGILSVVTITAYSRKSGSTGLSMVKIQQMRVEVSAKPVEKHDNEEKPL